MGFCHKLWFPYIFAIWCCRPLIFQSIKFVSSYSIRVFKYQSGCRDTGIGKFEFEAKTFYMISLHRFSTIADLSSDGTVLYMFCELNRFNMYCVISKSLQHTFLACKKDLRRRIESKVFVFNLFEYLSLTYVTRLKHPLPLDCLRLTHYSKKNVKSKNIKYEYLLETKGQQ